MTNNRAPAVIVPPQHQSAPKGYSIGGGVSYSFPKPLASGASARGLDPQGRMAVVHTGDDDIFGHEQHDPILEAQLAGMRERAQDWKSPAQTVESALEQYERNYRAAAEQRWPGQQRWQGQINEEMRVVRILHPDRFIDALKKAGVNCGHENRCVSEFIRQHQINYPCHHRSDPKQPLCAACAVRLQLELKVVGNGGPRIWLNDFSLAGRIGVTAWCEPERDTPEWEQNLFVMKSITSLQYPLGPEWSVMRFDQYNVPTREKYRGWRTALLTLIIAGLVTEAQAQAAFGVPLGEASLFYRQQLQQHRAMKIGLVTEP